MKNFSIEIVNRTPKLIYDIPSCIGQITIGSFSEKFVVPLSWWSIEDYESQWAEGIKRIEQGYSSCLVTAMTNPGNPMINWWLLYKEDNKIVIRNQMLFGNEWKKKFTQKTFDLDTCYDYIPTKAKGKVSEWIINS